MKTSLIWAMSLTFILSSCAVNQVIEEEDPRVAAFLRGDNMKPATETGPGLELRNGPDDFRYQITEKVSQFHDAVFVGRFMSSNLSRFDYHHPEENWEGIHLEALKTLESQDTNLDVRAKLTNLEALAFIVLDKYLNQVAMNQQVADATIYYLDLLQKLGSKVEFVLVATSFHRVKAYLGKETVKNWTLFYNDLFQSVQSSPDSNEYTLYAIAKAERILKSGL